MGLFGSMHCIGMCGPLVLGIFNQSIYSNPIHYFTYHIGKLIAYMIIGLFFGLIGESIHTFISQQKLSILTGSSMLIIYIMRKIDSQQIPFSKYSNKIYRTVTNYSKSLPLPKYYSLGLINGFLPCGLVYIAATSSVATGHLSSSIIWMFFFGIGTIPSLSVVLWMAQKVKPKRFVVFEFIYKNLTLLIAVLLILRGLNLGIPYLSPKIDLEKQEIRNCCHK